MAVRESSSSAMLPDEAPQIDVFNPVTGERIDTVPVFSADEVRAAAARARAAQPAWEALGITGRARLLRRWADRMWESQAEFGRILRAETGKNDSGAYSEMTVIDNTVAYYTAYAGRILRPQRRKTFLPFFYGSTVHYRPHGVVGAITPWNYPYLNLLIDVIPALIAGNTVVIKPSDVTPLTALYAVEKMRAVGIPADVVQIVTGAGDTGRALIDQVDFVVFTGSTTVGRKVAAQCAARLIPCTLELGGKDAAIILDDADLEDAALCVLRGGLENAGQACIGVERVYVEAGVYEPFVEILRARMEKMRCGCGDGFDVHMGSMTNLREIERVEAHLQDAVDNGARILVGGKRMPDQGPLFFEPTLVVDVDHRMRLMTEETFGPVLPVVRVRDAEEAIRLANDNHYGLSGSVFSRSEKRAKAVARRLQTGDVSINGTQLIFLAPGSPMGGVKDSGWGRRGGPEGLLRCVQAQAITIDRLPIRNREEVLASRLIRTSYAVMRAMRRVFPGL